MSFAGSLGTVLRGLNGTSDTVRDYSHASRTFVSDNYALLPKTKRWWHVHFELTPEARALYETIQAETNPGGNHRYSVATDNTTQDVGFLSVLAKTVKLPGIKMDTKKHNHYNKQVISINKVNYDDISIDFHDDASGYTRAFWDAYYLYHVQDSRYRDYGKMSGQGVSVSQEYWGYDTQNSPDVINSLTLYGNPALDTHHYGLDTVNASTGGRGVDGYLDRVSPFLKSIKIYHFSRPSGTGDEKEYPHYTEYTLVNPVITSWEQDTLDYSSGDPAVNSMGISYETLFYATGKLDESNSEIASWSDINKRWYDKSKSPLPNAQQRLVNTGIDLITNPAATARRLATPQGIFNTVRDVATWKGTSVPGINANFTGTGTGSKIINAAANSAQSYFNVSPSSINVPNAGGAVTALRTLGNKLKKPSK
jgi:hypothetical protein